MTTEILTELDMLLDKLATDDDFRAAMLSHPVNALDSLGINVDPRLIPALRSLPSKAVIARDQQAIKAKLSSAAGAFPFFLSGKL